VTVLAWATDVHLNFVSDGAVLAFADEFTKQGADRMLLGGDISEASSLEHHLRLLAERFARPIDFVLGNHDYYGGSIHEVRERCARIGEVSPFLRWIHGGDPVPIGRATCLVGCDGWGDARIGDVEHTKIVLNDFVRIRELVGRTRADRDRELRALGDESARALTRQLEMAVSFERILVLTHVPPWREACWHEHRISDEDWLPFFTCKAVGDALVAFADEHPRTALDVLCGHTHGGGSARIRSNLAVTTGDATYGTPAIAQLVHVT
jgi:predicted phosphohydrolase